MFEKVKNLKGPMRSIYLLTLFSAFSYAMVVFVNSSFLEGFVSKNQVGLLFTGGSILSFFVLSNLARLLKTFGQFRVAISIFSLNLLTLSFLIFLNLTKTEALPLSITIDNQTVLTILVATTFIIFYMTTLLMRTIIDQYLEEFSTDEETGEERGLFLTTNSLPYIFAPTIVGLLLFDSQYWKIYLPSAILTTIGIFIIISGLRHIKDVSYISSPFFETTKKVLANKDIRNIFISSFILQFFYSWMVIYTPVYLIQNIGLGWGTVGPIFSVMLLPFILFEYPLGKLADKKLGEKEILISGFLIMGTATISLSFILTQNPIIWAIALFMTRVGASAIETMNDTYFFKKIRANDSDLIAFFRNASPLAYIMGPAVATFFLLFIDFQYLFLVLGILTLGGVYFSATIEDTK